MEWQFLHEFNNLAMPPKKSNTLTEAELRLMKILWRRGESSVTDLVADLPKGESLAYNSILTTVRILGGVFGIAIATAVFSGFGGYASRATFTNGFVAAMAVCAALSLAGTLAALALPGRRPGLEVPSDSRRAASESQADALKG